MLTDKIFLIITSSNYHFNNGIKLHTENQMHAQPKNLHLHGQTVVYFHC